MKPTQQDIVDLAREAMLYLDGANTQVPLYVCKIEELERLVHLVLERFGAGGGEPVVAAVFDALLGRPVLVEDAPMLAPGQELYTLPSPNDLRAEYLRGLEAAAVMVEEWNSNEEYVRVLAEHIRALKGKQ